MLLQSDTTEALPSSGPIDDMSISASTAAAAAASVADGLGVVVAAAVTIVNIIPSSFYVLLLLATGCWMLDAGCGAPVVGFTHELTRPQNCMRDHGNISLRVPEADEPRSERDQANLERQIAGRRHIYPNMYRILCEADKRRIPAD